MDLTVVFLTNNKLPDRWTQFHKEKLLEATKDIPIITVSRISMWGKNIIQDYPPSKANIFYQLMRGLKLVDTKYFAVVEDDCLYPPDHFKLRPPNDETFIYNKHRWSLYTWNPIYNLKNWINTGSVLIGPTKLALDLLKERFEKYPMGGEMPEGMCGELGMYEKQIGLKPRRVETMMSKNPVIHLDHDYFTIHNPEKESIKRRHKKSLGTIQAYDIPYWGKAKDLTDLFQ